MKKDSAAKKYLGQEEIFADIFNAYLYRGKQVIDADKLHVLDTNVIASFPGSSRSRDIQKQRDLFKYVAGMKDDNATYIMLGIEHQSEIHYAMPIKNLLYDVAEYQRQIEAKAKEYVDTTADGEKVKFTGPERLSLFKKDDKLTPVITLVVYCGTEPWDGPMSVHDMLNTDDPNILRLVPDYRINLLDLSSISEEDVALYRTNFAQVAWFIRNSKDGRKLKEYVESTEEFKNMDELAADFLNAINGRKFKKIRTPKGGVNVCKGVENWAAYEVKIATEETAVTTAVAAAKSVGASIEWAAKLICPQLNISFEEAQKRVTAAW